MKVARTWIAQLAEIILDGGAVRATKYVSDKLTVKATRQTYKGRIDKRARAVTMLVTVGIPNYVEREFIKKCKQAGEPFPVKKIQVKWPKVLR